MWRGRCAVTVLVLGWVQGCPRADPLLADGAPCSAPSACQGGACMDGACTRACQDENECGEGRSCARMDDTGASRLCRARGAMHAPGEACVADADCVTRVCEAFLCRELCTACGTGERCQPMPLERGGAAFSMQVCQPAYAPDVVELGAVATTSVDSEELTFRLPEGVGSFTVVVESGDEWRVGVHRLVSPSGVTLLDLADTAADRNPGTIYVGAAAVLVPATDDPSITAEPGTWRLHVATFDLADVVGATPVAGMVERVAVVMERPVARGGSMDLSLGWAPGTGVTAETAEASPFVTGMLDVARAYLADQAGVSVGSVEHFDVPADHDIVEDGNEARDVCRAFSRAGPRGNSINVFVVDDLQFTAGFAGGIPGPPGLFGAPSSGIVLERLGSGSDTGVLLAHELLHYVGLRHTTETTGAKTDPISDTPACPPGTDAASCPDYGNLMFPVFPLRTDLVLTAGQRHVVAGSPWLVDSVLPNACAGTSTVDITDTPVTLGSTAGLGDALSGTCGGAGTRERVHLLRLRETSARLVVESTGPHAVYVRAAGCTGPELACVAATAGRARVELNAPAAGAYFVVVDGDGDFTLRVGG